MTAHSLFTQLHSFSEAVDKASQRAGRGIADVTIEFATKTQSAETINNLAYFCEGNPVWKARPWCIGENYLQEYERKSAAIVTKVPNHFIGPLQSNKVKKVCELFDCIESVSSEKLLTAINKEAAKLSKVQDVLLQVNISNDSGKGGFGVSEVKNVFETAAIQHPALNITGLMTITRYYDKVADVRDDFKKMYRLYTELNQRRISLGSHNRSGATGQSARRFELSMGMSRDYDIAIEEGATIVRVGSLIFGERE